jgi:hypothetical protein
MKTNKLLTTIIVGVLTTLIVFHGIVYAVEATKLYRVVQEYQNLLLEEVELNNRLGVVQTRKGTIEENWGSKLTAETTNKNKEIEVEKIVQKPLDEAPVK